MEYFGAGCGALEGAIGMHANSCHNEKCYARLDESPVQSAGWMERFLR